MTVRVVWTRRLVSGVAAAALSVSLASCSDSEKEQKPAAGASTAAAEGYPFDTSDVGDDLLVDKRSSSTFGGKAPMSWRFPTFYAEGETDETSTTIEVDDVRFGLLAVASTSSTPRAKAEEFASRLRLGKGGGIYDVTIGGRDWVAVVDDGDDFSQVVLLGAFPGQIVAGAGFTAQAPLADVPPERIDELHEMAQSIEVEAGSSR
ncbi:hypothetical protein [Aeromicrobium chenweiae]|uniref:Uncharacterized protein n=1 Tax=Aeromicrobium chenweiae TaxID=2079793 RepID=A0A2S0WNG3_9ACTN|nr:hypothetical protein [Aeromicrobium chenweiae]AWB92842.1 hypothetical protein C3E78_11860 [Aeromicrobium chenweiae]TGN33836.1 hypothetical protein E4L97_01910 [Aeromicrobium chenweiae]